MKTIKEEQQQGKAPDMISANKDASVMIKEVEKHMVHVSLRIPGFDQITGQPLHKPQIQCFYPEFFGDMDKDKAFKGYITKIVHDPRTEKEVAADLANDVVKPLERMNKAELQAEYLRVFETEPVSDLKNEDLRTAIAEKLSETGK